MYKENMGETIRILRSYVCGYSQRKLAKMVNEDIETIKMIEDGRLRNPKPQLILRISDVLDTCYMDFVEPDYEEEFLVYLDWGTDNLNSKNFMKDLVLILSDAAILIHNNPSLKHKIESC